MKDVKKKRKPDERQLLLIKNRINNIREQMHVVGMYLQEVEKWHGPNVDPTRLAVYGVLNEVKAMEEEMKAESSKLEGGEL